MKCLDLSMNPFDKLDNEWALVTAGNKDDFNSMTISWGGFGRLWFKDVATIYIRSSRYTYEYLKNNEYFTISFYDREYKKDLGIMGSVSGRDGDKVSKTNLTPKYLDNSVTYNEANLTLVCKKLYIDELDINNIPKDIVEEFYNNDEPHYIIIGEIVEKL